MKTIQEVADARAVRSATYTDNDIGSITRSTWEMLHRVLPTADEAMREFLDGQRVSQAERSAFMDMLQPLVRAWENQYRTALAQLDMIAQKRRQRGDQFAYLAVVLWDDISLATHLVAAAPWPLLVASLTRRYERRLRAVRARPGRTVSRQKVKNAAPDQVSRVVQGDDLPNVVPSEWALLNDSTSALFYLRYAQQELVQVQRHGVAVDNTNPLILVFDRSGSMDTDLEVDSSNVEADITYPRYVWAMALALMMYRAARARRRPLVLVPFSSNAAAFVIASDEQQPLIKLLEAFDYIGGGGTAFLPWMEALQAIAKEWRHADVCVLSDGSPNDWYGLNIQRFNNIWRRLRQQCAMRAFGVVLTFPHTEALAEQNLLRTFCDDVALLQAGQSLDVDEYLAYHRRFEQQLDHVFRFLASLW